MKYKRRLAVDISPETWKGRRNSEVGMRNRNSVINSRRSARTTEEHAKCWEDSSSKRNGIRSRTPSHSRVIKESSTRREQVSDRATGSATGSRSSPRGGRSSWEGIRELHRTTGYRCSDVDYTIENSTRCWEEKTEQHCATGARSPTLVPTIYEPHGWERLTNHNMTNSIKDDSMQTHATVNDPEPCWRDIKHQHNTQVSAIGSTFEEIGSCVNCGTSHPSDYICPFNYYEQNQHADSPIQGTSSQHYEGQYSNRNKIPNDDIKEEPFKKKIRKCRRNRNNQPQFATRSTLEPQKPLQTQSVNTSENTRASLLIAIETLKDVLVSLYEGQDPVQALKNGLNNLVLRYDSNKPLSF